MLLTKPSVLLLALQELLSMVIAELIAIAIDIVRPPQRNSAREDREDDLPELRHNIGLFKDLSRVARARMLHLGISTTLCRAQEALLYLRRPFFQSQLSWGSEEPSLDEMRANVLDFHNKGHYGLAYILQIKMLQAGVDMMQQEEEDLLACRRHFTDDLRLLYSQANLPAPTHLRECLVFMPRILIRLPTFAKEILRDDRPDWLGRQSFQALSDAGLSIKWTSAHVTQSWRDVHFECDDLSLVSKTWFLQAINSADTLGRTALHVAVRHGLICSAMTLVAAGADMHVTCLNGLNLLHIAACQGNTEMIRHLIDNDAYRFELDRMDRAYRTPFWYAARGSHMNALNALTARPLRGQVNVEHEDLCGHSALAIAARDGRSDVLDRLFRLRNRVLNAEVLAPPPNEYLVFVYAVLSRNARCIELVREHRTWRYGDDIWRKAMEFANLHRDDTLRAELQSLYRTDSMHDLSRTLREPRSETYPLTDLSVLMASTPWVQLASTFELPH